MFERITPNATTSYEQNLVEYVGVVFIQGGLLVASASPGVTVSHGGAMGSGIFEILCNDNLPVYQQINNNPYTVGGVPAQDMGAIAAGFSSTAMLTVTAIQYVSPPYTGSVTAIPSAPIIPSPGQLAFILQVFLNGAPYDGPFAFKILVTGQMDQFVNGIGA